MLSSVVEVLSQIGPEQLITTDNFWVAVKFGIYIGVPRKLHEVYFMKFHRAPKTCSETGKLPQLVPLSRLSLVRNIMNIGNLSKKVDDVSLVRLKGKFRIPISARQIGDRRYALKYLEGYGVMYALTLRAPGSRTKLQTEHLLKNLTKGKILGIIEELSKERIQEK